MVLDPGRFSGRALVAMNAAAELVHVAGRVVLITALVGFWVWIARRRGR